MTVEGWIFVVVTIFNAGLWFGVIRRGLRDAKGISMKVTKVIKVLNQPEWADTPERKRSASELIIKD